MRRPVFEKRDKVRSKMIKGGLEPRTQVTMALGKRCTGENDKVWAE